MIVYKKTNGVAHDARLVPDTHVPTADELTRAGWEIPSLDELSDPQAIAQRDAAKSAEESRIAVLRDDALAKELLSRLAVATPQQIDSYVDNNLADLADARALFKRVLRVLALIA